MVQWTYSCHIHSEKAANEPANHIEGKGHHEMHTYANAKCIRTA